MSRDFSDSNKYMYYAKQIQQEKPYPKISWCKFISVYNDLKWTKVYELELNKTSLNKIIFIFIILLNKITLKRILKKISVLRIKTTESNIYIKQWKMIGMGRMSYYLND